MSPKVTIARVDDLPPVPCTLGGMDWNPTGLWRYLTPAPRDKAAPCHAACPANNPIPQLMALWARGQGEAALDLLLAANPLPGVTGRLCFHPCQPACLRRKVDRALPVQGLERWAADQGQTRLRPVRPKGQAVAVVGAGPAGLTCAYLLGRQGLRVTLYDPAAQAGGFLVGAKGLPAKILKTEVERLVRLAGIKLVLNSECAPEAIAGGRPGPALVVIDDSAHPASAAWPIPEPAGGAAWLRAGAGRDGKGFKASQAALAVGLGQALAAQALARLAGQEQATAAAPEMVDEAAVKPERFAPERPPRKPPARLDAKRARQEAGRCLSCGACNLCQQCVLFCPDACLGLDPDGAGVRVDLAHCKGCGICAQECPRGVISMEAGQ